MTNSERPKLQDYIQDKLGMSVGKFAALEGTPSKTIRSRWATPGGRVTVKDAVFRLGVERLL